MCTHQPSADVSVLSEHEGDVYKHRQVAEYYGNHVGTRFSVYLVLDRLLQNNNIIKSGCQQLYVVSGHAQCYLCFIMGMGLNHDILLAPRIGTTSKYNGSFTLPDSDSDSDSEGFPFGYKCYMLKVYIAQIQTRIPIPDGCIGNPSPSPNLSPAM